MNARSNESEENRTHSKDFKSIDKTALQLQKDELSTFQFSDHRTGTLVQRRLQEQANNSNHIKRGTKAQAMANDAMTQRATIQKKINPESNRTENRTGLPDTLKTGIENLSGLSLDDVKVHFNSNKPAQLQAHGFAQGTNIHLASGQEKHLPHEAWHVVQQKQGRVRPTLQMKNKVNINDNVELENEADIMGAKAMQMKSIEGRAFVDLRQHSGKPVFQLVRSVGSHKALDKGNIRNLAWQSIEEFAMEDELVIANNNEALWHNVNHVWGHSAVNAVDGWINESKVSKNAPDLGDVLWRRATRGAANYNDVLVNLGYNLGWVAAHGEPWFVLGATDEANTKTYARLVMNGQESTPGDFAADAVNDAELIAVLNANPFIIGMIGADITRVGAPAPPALGAPNVIGGVQNPTDMLRRAAHRFDAIVTTPVPQIDTENVSKVDPVSYMSHGTAITRGTGATEGVLLHEMGHHLENNLNPADFATIHNFLRARSEDDGHGAPRMKGVGYGKLSGNATAGQGYDTTPINYNVKNMQGIGMKSHLAKLGIKKGFPLNSDATKTSAKEEIEDSMLAWGNSDLVSYHTQSDDGNYATEFLSTSIEFFAKGTTIQRMIAADPLRVALLLYLANRPQYVLVRDALQARFHLPVPMPGMNYMLDNLIHKVSI